MSELKPKPVPAPPSNPVLDVTGGEKPPLQAGKVYMTDYTRQQLQQLGWHEGDPLPGDLGERIKQLQEEINSEKEAVSLETSELAKHWKPVRPKFTDISELPEDKQQELRDYIQGYKQQVEQQQAMEETIPSHVQGHMRDIARQHAGAAESFRAKMQKEEEGGIVDDRAAVAQAAPAASSGLPAPDAPPQTSGEPVPSAVTEHPGVCPRCAWNLTLPFEPEVTEQDKRTFIAALLGPTRFVRAYTLLNGAMTLYFRSLTSEESAILHHQLGWDVRNGLIRGDLEYWGWLMEYRLVMSLLRIDGADNQPQQLIPPLFEWSRANPARPSQEPEAVSDTPFTNQHRAPTALPRMRDWFYREVAASEPLRKVLGQQHREFQSLVEKLEAMTSDSNFWRGIEQPA